jgi:hypothetical protein
MTSCSDLLQGLDIIPSAAITLCGRRHHSASQSALLAAATAGMDETRQRVARVIAASSVARDGERVCAGSVALQLAPPGLSTAAASSP